MHILFRTLIIISSLTLVINSAYAETSDAKSSKKPSDDWAASVTDTQIDFGSDKVEASGKRAMTEIQKISRDIQGLKSEVVALNKDLRLMEEKLLFPSSTKFDIFVSMTSGQFFDLESIKVKIDDRLVATHVYSYKQRQALLRGGTQRLYVTNLSEGKHQVTVFFTGIGPGGRAYKRAAEAVVKKGPGSQYLEVAISDDVVSQEPVFTLKEW